MFVNVGFDIDCGWLFFVIGMIEVKFQQRKLDVLCCGVYCI